MDLETKVQIGRRLRKKREQAGYTREKLGELCNLSPRFIANIEFGDSSLSLDSLMTICRVLSCSSDDILFGDSLCGEAWAETASRLSRLDIAYQPALDKALQGILETIIKAEQRGKEKDAAE
ncbi:MAG: helix-turn-helix transcriptional regulator [Oscillospiraceae bacterium]|nr:helix-turn-helix transcriptional regulator [Oscillospiraceae bacterium]